MRAILLFSMCLCACGGSARAWKTGPAEPIPTRSWVKRLLVRPDAPWTGAVDARAGELVLVLTEGQWPYPVEMTNAVVEKPSDGVYVGRVQRDGEVRIHVSSHIHGELDLDVTVMPESELPVSVEGLSALEWGNEPPPSEGRREFVSVARVRAGEIVVVSPLLEGTCQLHGGTPIEGLSGTGAAAGRATEDGKIFASCSKQDTSYGRFTSVPQAAHGWIHPGDLRDDEVVAMLTGEAQGREQQNEAFAERQRKAQAQRDELSANLKRRRDEVVTYQTGRGGQLYEEWKGELVKNSSIDHEVTVPGNGGVVIVIISTTPELFDLYSPVSGETYPQLDRHTQHGITQTTAAFAGKEANAKIKFRVRARRDRSYGIVMLFTYAALPPVP